MIKKLSKYSLFDKLCDNLDIKDVRILMLRCMGGEYFALTENEEVISILFFLNEDGDYEIINYKKKKNGK